MIRNYELQREILGKDVFVSLIRTENGIQVLLAGGDQAHIGAVGIIDECGKQSVICFPSHREDVIVEAWSRRIHDMTGVSVVVSAGIHYDHLQASQIEFILRETDRLLVEVERLLQ